MTRPHLLLYNATSSQIRSNQHAGRYTAKFFHYDVSLSGCVMSQNLGFAVSTSAIESFVVVAHELSSDTAMNMNATCILSYRLYNVTCLFCQLKCGAENNDLGVWGRFVHPAAARQSNRKDGRLAHSWLRLRNHISSLQNGMDRPLLNGPRPFKTMWINSLQKGGFETSNHPKGPNWCHCVT
jgi:hypothetical protein